MKTVYSCTIAGYEITLLQKNERTFSVVYGYDQTHNLDYVQASQILGACMMHALTCEGKID